MSTSTLGLFLRHLALSEEVSRLGTTSDRDLLAAYEAERGEAAFTELMRRHGPMVLRTCRRVLGHGSDAEDAFQATFVLLARKAGQLRREVRSLGGWLHHVAYQTARKVLSGEVRRKAHEQQASAMTHSVPDPSAEASWNEIRPILDAELDALPEQARCLLIACYLQGKTHAEAAAELRLPQGSVARHLERARVLLAMRLARRGITVSALLLAILLEDSAKGAGVPATLLVHSVEAVRTFTEQATGIVSDHVARLVKGGLAQMAKGWTHLSMMLAAWVGLLGAGLIACQTLKAWPDQTPPSEPPMTAAAQRPAREAEKPARTDCFGDPLPPGALARMGTTRFFSYYTAAVFPSQIFAFSPDGKLLASLLDRKIVVLWDAATGKEMRRLTLDDTAKSRAITVLVPALDFAPDGKTLVAVTCDQRVCLWEVGTGKLLRTVVYQGAKGERAEAPRGRVAFLPDGQILAVADVSKAVEGGEWLWECHVWDAATGKEVRQLLSDLKKRNDRHLRYTAFSPDGKLLAIAADHHICLWDVATGKEIHHNLAPYRDVFVALAFSHDGKTLASSSERMVSLSDVATGKLLRRLEAPTGGCGTPLAFSPDDKTLVAGREGHLWQVSTGAEVLSLGLKNATGALFSPNGKILAVTEPAGRIRLWEADTGKEILPRPGHQDGIQSIAYSPDGKTLASGSKDGTVRLWEVATGKELRQLAKHDYRGYCSVAYSPDGKMLVSLDDMIHLWDTATGKEIRQFKKGEEDPRSAIFSPDGKILAATLGGHMVCLWQVATGKEIYALSTGRSIGGGFCSVAFSPDGRMLAVPSKAGKVDLWEVATGKSIGQLQATKEPVRSLAFAPDGKILATSSMGDKDKTRLWEVASGEEIGQLDGVKDSGEVWSLLAFSPDGRILATAAQGNIHQGEPVREVRLWEVVSGKAIGRLSGHQAPVRTLAFAPDGKTLVSGSDDLTCLVWDVAAVGDRLKPAGGSLLKPAVADALSAKSLSKEQLESAWADLANTDPAKAYRAVSALRATPGQAVSLLKERVRPAAPVADPKQLARWIVDLDDERFEAREKAQRAIQSLGEPAIPALRRALTDQPPLEVKRRLREILAAIEPKLVTDSPGQLWQIRALQVLESIATPEARQVLHSLAKGVAGVSLTQEAQAVLERLATLERLAGRSASKP